MSVSSKQTKLQAHHLLALKHRCQFLIDMGKLCQIQMPWLRIPLSVCSFCRCYEILFRKRCVGIRGKDEIWEIGLGDVNGGQSGARQCMSSLDAATPTLQNVQSFRLTIRTRRVSKSIVFRNSMYERLTCRISAFEWHRRCTTYMYIH